MPTDPVPSVGHIVHYVSHGSPVLPDGSQRYRPQCRAAIITAVPEYLIEEPFDGCPNGTDGRWIASLAVVNPTGVFFAESAQLSGNEDDGEGAGGSWHWPERA